MTLNQIALVFPLLMVVAAIWDLATLRIPNFLNLSIAGLFFPVAFLLGMPMEMMIWHLAAGLAVLTGGILLFLTGKFGGGDAKMIAAGALWLGWDLMLSFLVMTALCGGALVILWLIYRPVKLTIEIYGAAWIKRPLPDWSDLPYGIAIGSAAVIIFSSSWWVTNFPAA